MYSHAVKKSTPIAMECTPSKLEYYILSNKKHSMLENALFEEMYSCTPLKAINSICKRINLKNAKYVSQESGSQNLNGK